MELALLRILVLVHLDSLVINVKSLFASLNSLMTLQYAVVTEDVLLQIHVYALPHTKEINVNILFVLELFQLKQVLFAQVMEIVPSLMSVLAMKDGLEIIVNLQSVTEPSPQIHPFVSQEETALNQTTVLVIHFTMDLIVNTPFAMEFQINLEMFVVAVEIVKVQIFVIAQMVTMDPIANLLCAMERTPQILIFVLDTESVLPLKTALVKGDIKEKIVNKELFSGI
jgi:hypothetical protein